MTPQPQPQPRVPRDRPDDALVSVVCPVYREEATIREFHRRATEAMEAITPAVRHELIYVNDGSDDASGEILREICAADPRAKLVDLSRNFGHQLAITAGIDHAGGDAVATIDTDLQDPPEVIGEMVARWREGWDVVYGQRHVRPGEPRLRLFAIRAFYRVLNRLSDIQLPVDTGDFRLMDRRVRDQLASMQEENRYLRGLVAWVGFDQTAVIYERDERFAGESNYGFTKLARLGFDGLTSFSERPLRFASGIGLLVTAASVLIALYIIIAKIVDPSQAIQGYASLIVAVLFFGGLQLLALGLLGEYVGRTYRESKQRPLYVVGDSMNLRPATPPPAVQRAAPALEHEQV